MTEAWAGAGTEQQVAQEPHGGAWHQVAHQIGDLIGWNVLMLAAGIGLVVIFRKKVSGWFKS